MIFGNRGNIFNNKKVNLKTRKSIELKVDDFGGGVNTLFSETRLEPNEAKEATNLMLAEDGVWKKRWGTAAYGGVSWTNTPDGFAEYKKTDGSRELIVVGDGKVYRVDPSAGSKTEISGATFTQGTACDFVQADDYLYIVNGTDDMARYDGSTLSTYSSISTPSWDGTPLTRGAGLSSGSYNYYYRVSAVNEVGETLAAAEETIAVDMDRDSWSAADEYIQLDWGDVGSAIKYVIYFADTSGYEERLTEVTVSTYQDDGSAGPNEYITPVTESTAAGPKFKSIAVIGNRIWGTGDPNNEQRVYWSGSGAQFGNFAPGFDGGWVDLEQGSRTQVVKVVDYNKEVHTICKTDDGKGSIWEIDLGTTTIAGETITVPVPTKIIAQMGTNSQRSIVHVENDLYFLNPYGVYTLGFEPNVLNVLRTKEQSIPVRPYIRDAYESDMNRACAYYYESKIFFSLPTSSGNPNRIFLYDRERKAWVKDWSIGVTQFGEFTDSSGDTHLLGINGTGLVKFSNSYQGDSGTAFTWTYVSPRFSVSDDWSQFARVHRAYIRMRSVRGTIDFSFGGTTRNGNTTTLQADTVTQGVSDTGLGWDKIGTVQIGDTDGAPTLFAQESLTRYLNIYETLKDVQWEISGDSMNDEATITGLRLEGKLVKVESPESWRLD